MLLDFLFPKFCVGCGFLGTYICLTCQHNLLVVERDTCFYCRKGSLNGFTHPGCIKKSGIDGFLTVFYYNNQAKRIIKNIKYRLAKDIYPELLLLIPPAFSHKLTALSQDAPLLLQSIPLHDSKQKIRGFNQCDMFGRFVHSRIANSKIVDVLMRNRPTAPQAQIQSAREKGENVRGCFTIKNSTDVKSSNVILIEDVVTSGSTVKEACKILKNAGAKRVFVAALTRG